MLLLTETTSNSITNQQRNFSAYKLMSLKSTMLSTDITCKEILKILTNKDAVSFHTRSQYYRVILLATTATSASYSSFSRLCFMYLSDPFNMDKLGKLRRHHRKECH